MRIFALAAVALLWATGAVNAAPVRCSDEAKACVAACGSLPAQQRSTACHSACQARLGACRQTGCWDNGSSRYCGLLRQ